MLYFQVAKMFTYNNAGKDDKIYKLQKLYFFISGEVTLLDYCNRTKKLPCIFKDDLIH